MPPATSPRPVSESPAPGRARILLRFGRFELTPATGELRRQGRPVRLQPQPAKVLALLASRAGELVTREELYREVWGADTYVDFDQALSFCIRQVRIALADSAEAPTYVETVPRRGYRFVAPVEVVELASSPLRPATPQAVVAPPAPSPAAPSPAAPLPAAAESPELAPLHRRLTLPVLAAAGAFLAVGLLIFLLGARSRGGAGPERALLAVLPFEDLGGAPRQEWLTDGLTEELITRLGGIDPERLGVIARTSAMRYKGSRAPVDRIARELGVAYLLEGSVRRHGERVRVAAQLISARDQTQLWAASYDRTAADTLDVQREVAESVARALALKLLPAESAPVAGPDSAASAAAREAYLKGLYLLRQGHPEELARAVEILERTVAEHPGFAPAWAAYAEALAGLPRAPRELMPRVRAAARRAVALDPGQAGAHRRLGTIHLYYDWDWEAARREYERAIEIDPGDAANLHAYAGYFSVLGRHDEALAQMKRARELDPVSTSVLGDVGWYSFFARRYGEAIEGCRATLELEPRNATAMRCLVTANWLQGNPAQAYSMARRLMVGQGAAAAHLAALGEPGLAAYWRWTLEDLDKSARQEYVSPANQVIPNLELGDPEAAFRALEQAYAERSGWLLPFLAVEPRLDPLRSDPRYRDLLRRLRLPEQPPKTAALAVGLGHP